MHTLKICRPPLRRAGLPLAMVLMAAALPAQAERLRRMALAALATGFLSSAHAGFVVTTFGASQWGASDSTLGVAGYTIEDFENTALAAGLTISRLNGANGNFAPTSVLPVGSVFDPSTDNDTNVGDPSQSLQVLRRGVWDGGHVLINNPGPAFYHWYLDSGNWKDLQFDFQGGSTSVGFSLQQMELTNNRLLINGTVFVSDLLALLGAETELQNGTEGPFAFNSRNGYIRIDATGVDLIQSITLDNDSGDGFAVDHLAFLPVPAAVPEPGGLPLVVIGLVTLALRRRSGRLDRA